MNFQNLKPDMPPDHERSASHGSGRNRFAAALLLGVILFPAVPAAAKSSLPHISMMVYGNDPRTYEDGACFLVSQPFSQVKAKLEKSLAAKSTLKKFKANDESAPLSHMEPHWADIAVSHHPEVQAALSQQINKRLAATFTTALTAGVITAEERTRFEQAIAQQQGYDKDTTDRHPFFSQPIARWSYERHRTGSHRYKDGSHRYNDDYVKIMDISPLLGRAPVTLIWFTGFGGIRTKFNRHQLGLDLSLSISASLDTFPDLPTIKKGAKRLDPRLKGFMRRMAKMAKLMPVLSNNDARDAMRAYSVGVFGRKKAAPETFDVTAAPATDVQGFDLPVDEAQIRPAPGQRLTWQMLAVPDGSVMASGLASHRFVQREAKIERLDAMPGLYPMEDLKIDPDGTVWGHSMTSDGARFFQSWSLASASGSTYQVCDSNRLSVLLLGLSLDQMSRTCDPRYPDDWIVRPGQGIAFSSGAELFALDKQGKWTHRTWDEKLRRTVSGALDQVMPRVDGGDILIRFGDGLLWRADHDAYGIDPMTARVVRTIAKPRQRIFFGSLSANWGFGFSTEIVQPDDYFPYRPELLWPYPGNFRITDLATGEPRLDVKTGALIYHCSVARSAHGQLLAINDNSGLAVVLNMKEGKPLATLRVPNDYAIDAMVFSWQGDKLWIYARKTKSSGGRKMIVWDIPAELADATQGMDVPDQLRFNFDIFRCDALCDHSILRPGGSP